MTLENDLAKLEKLKEESEQIKAKRIELEAKIKEKKRKERTRRLIQVGAILDSVGITTEDLAILFKNKFLNSKEIKPLFENFMAQNSNPIHQDNSYSEKTNE